MSKWADYLISEVTYDHDHLISVAIRHKDSVQGISEGKPIDRLAIASDIKNGLSYLTIYNAKDSWKKGHKIQTFSLSGNPYLRIDENKVELDYLGDLPEVSIEPESVQSQPSPEEEATPEQLARLEQLEKQLQELESQPSPEPPSSPWGSLPKESATQLQELESQPSPEEEIINQLNELQDQLDELEKKLSSQLLHNNNSKQEYTTNQLSEIQNQLDDLSKLSKKLELFSSKNQLEKSSISAEFNDDIEDLKNSSKERKIIQTLEKQTYKLDEIEKKVQNSNISNNWISEKQLPEAYCVKCKTKRKILNSEEIQMKNGRPAVKGICSFCSCKVFKFLKIKNR